jgi:hypothetical protein
MTGFRRLGSSRPLRRACHSGAPAAPAAPATRATRATPAVPPLPLLLPLGPLAPLRRSRRSGSSAGSAHLAGSTRRTSPELASSRCSQGRRKARTPGSKRLFACERTSDERLVVVRPECGSVHSGGRSTRRSFKTRSVWNGDPPARRRRRSARHDHPCADGPRRMARARRQAAVRVGTDLR